MTLTLTLDGVSYGELYEFVDAARAAGVPADEKVRCLGSDDKGDRFELELGPGRRRPGAGPAAAVVVGDGPGQPPAGGGGRGAAPVNPAVARVADTVRGLVRDDDDLDRLVAALKDLRRFLR